MVARQENDFPETRAIIAHLPTWVEAFAARLPGPTQVPHPNGGFLWEHPAKDAETLQVAKAVRMASGIRAAMALADLGHTVECGVILRTVADFAAEITFVGEGLLEHRFTAEQNKFIEQHFSQLPLTPDELAAREREYYVGRKAIAKAHERLATKSGTPADEYAKTAAFLSKGYDGFVHGSYGSAMELFTGRTMAFMMQGHESTYHICVLKVSVAGKLKEVLLALRFMAITRGMAETQGELRAAFERIDRSGEDAGLPCGRRS